MLAERFAAAPHYTFFHSDEWRKALLDTFPHLRDVSRVIVLPDGREVWLPLLETERVGWWRWIESMPFAFFGGPVAIEGDLEASDLTSILDQIRSHAGFINFNFDPRNPTNKSAARLTGAQPLTTHLLNLESGFETVLHGFTKTMRYDMRRAERDGVTVRKGQGEADFDTYHALTERAAQRWGLAHPPFPLALYRALALLPEDRVHLWLADFEGQPVGGLLNVYYAPGKVIHWASALDPAYLHLSPTKLLQRTAIQHACEWGAVIYNMGPSAGFDGQSLAGVREAKEALGAQPHEYHVLVWMNTWPVRLRALRNRLAQLFD